MVSMTIMGHKALLTKEDEMNKFKVKIVSADGGRWYKNGETHEVSDLGNGYYSVSAGSTIVESHCELVFLPEPGEMIEVHDGLCMWHEREFRTSVDGKFVVMTGAGKHVVYAEARPIKKTHTITLEDGTKVELSEESFKALQEGAGRKL